MKVKQIATVRYSAAYCSGYNGLEITDVDGTEIHIKMTNDEWLDLEDRVKDKCNRIREKRQGEIDQIVTERVAAALESKESEVE